MESQRRHNIITMVASSSSLSSSSTATCNIYSNSQSFIRHFLSFLFATSVIQVTLSCEFPATVLTNGTGSLPGQTRDWRQRIREQYSEYDLQLEIGAKTMRTISVSGTTKGRVLHTRACLRALDGGKYLVAHEEPGQTGARYSCIQFVRRSDDVMQIRCAPVEDKFSLAVCNDNRLELDRWLIVDAAHVGRNPLPCPLRGGYLVGMFDKMRARGVCDAWKGEVRLESECSTGEGMTFYFRTQKCVPEDLMMFSTQPVLCLANWADASYTYTLLRHSELNYYWVFRLPSRALGSGDSFTSYLFKDLIAENVEYSEETFNYVRMDLSRDSTADASRLCADDYEICSRVQPPCTDHNAHLTLVCPVTCGLCDSGSTSFCSLPSDWTGRWYDLGGGVSKKALPAGHASSRRRLVTVNSTSLTIHEGSFDDENFRCVRWSTSRDTNNFMLVRTFPRGCRSRYTCVKQVKRSESLLYLRLSDTVKWPLVKSSSDPVDCASFTYDHTHYGDPQTIDLSITASTALLLVETGSNNRLKPVPCAAPTAEYVDYGVSFSSSGSQHRRRTISSADCYASLSLSQSQTSLSFKTDECETNGSSLPSTETYDCLESSVLDVDHTARLIIAQPRSTPSDLICWLFPKPTVSSTAFYLLNVSQCHMVLRRDSRVDRIHHYTALFSSRTRRIAALSTSGPTRRVGVPVDAHERTYSNRVVVRPMITEPISVNIQTTATSVESSNNSSYNNTRSDRGTEEPPTSNPFVISSAVVILAILQTVLLCGCL